MSAAPFTGDPLAWIVDPVPQEEFLAATLGRQFRHIRNPNRQRFQQLLSLAQLDEVLGTFGLRHPDVRLVRLEEDIRREEYTWKETLLDPMRIGRLFASGATLIFDSLQDHHEGLRRLCSALTAQATARTQANIYLTPTNAQGFKPHWDTHDVFIMQVEGNKHWRLYDGGPHSPRAEQGFDPKVHAPGEVIHDFVMEAGDVLYIPRGLMHAATAMEQVSLHITLGLIPYTWSELVSDVVNEVADRLPSWRANVPFGFGRHPAGGAEALREGLAERLGALTTDLNLQRVIELRQEKLDATQRPRASDYLQQAISASNIAQEDWVAMRPDLPGRLSVRGDRVVLLSAQREVEFPLAAQRTLEAILQNEGGALGQVDDDLDWEGRQTVIATLIREGILANGGKFTNP